ncbi:MAG: hypothetical protein HY741_29850 [Chloroflexi bacterium]|nr:hypothetical protein [Chloroflexota bacterium]
MLDRNLFRLARSQRALFFATLALAFVGALFIVAQAWLVSVIIDRVFMGQQTLNAMLPEIGWLASVMLARALVHGAGEWTASALAIRVKQNLRALVLEHLLALGPAYARGERTGELTNTAVEGTETLDAYFAQYLPQLVIAALVPLVILVAVFPLDVLSAIVFLLTAPLIPFFMRLIGNAADTLTKRQFQRASLLSAQFLDALQGLTTLKLLNASRAMSVRIQHASEEYAKATLFVLRVAFLSAFVLELIATLSTAIVAVEIGLRVLYHQMTFQPALFLLMLAPEFYIPLRMLGLRFHAAAAGAAAAQRIFEILNTPLPAAPSFVHKPVLALKKIRFENVAFAYADDRAALRDVSFELRANS